MDHSPRTPIVSEELWELANRALEKNRQTSRRNAKEPFLLTGLVKCSVGGHTFTGINQQGGKGHTCRLYRCGSKFRTKTEREMIGCTQGMILCRSLDDAAWAVASSVVMKPHILLEALDEHFANDGNADLLRQIEHLQGKIGEKAIEDEKNRKAY